MSWRTPAEIFYRLKKKGDDKPPTEYGPFPERQIMLWCREGYFWSGQEFTFGDEPDVVYTLRELIAKNGFGAPFSFVIESEEQRKDRANMKEDMEKLADLVASNKKHELKAKELVASAEAAYDERGRIVNSLKAKAAARDKINQKKSEREMRKENTKDCPQLAKNEEKDRPPAVKPAPLSTDPMKCDPFDLFVKLPDRPARVVENVAKTMAQLRKGVEECDRVLLGTNTASLFAGGWKKCTICHKKRKFNIAQNFIVHITCRSHIEAATANGGVINKDSVDFWMEQVKKATIKTPRPLAAPPPVMTAPVACPPPMKSSPRMSKNLSETHPHLFANN